ncbi:MAG: right-handed parallel beta-helix repeat-containing protein [Lachnospiraceae bacterium]|nr:right-handed parallel beta-helix repeat-containing protein [Lachnospiraceae bacterium]
MKFDFVTEDRKEMTEAFQRAIDLAAERKEQLIIAPGEYVTGTLRIRPGSDIYLSEGAVIIGSENVEDYSADITPFVDAVGVERGRALIYAENADGAVLSGPGVIDGRGKLHQHANRPFLMRIVGGKNITVRDIEVRDSAAWTIHLFETDDVLIENVTIRSRVNANNDGIDIDSCNHITIRGCDISSGDDGICIKSTTHRTCSNIIAEDCRISSEWAGIKLGTESIGDFENITFRNCEIYDTEGCGIKVVPVDGANLKKLAIENIIMKNTTGPIFISLGSRLRTYFKGDIPRELGSITDISIRNIKADVVDAAGRPMQGNDYYITYDGMWGRAGGCIVINGLPERKVENILLENLDLKMPGGVERYDREDDDIIEMEKQYPEFSVFGALPASVAFLRHVKNVTIKNIAYQLKREDVRPAFRMIDAQESVIR